MSEQLKNNYTLEYIKNLASKIKEHYKNFDEEGFINAIFDNSWQNLELKARMRHIALNLNKYLLFNYKEQLAILKPVSKDFGSFEALFFQDFVEVFGLDDFEESFKALEIFTIDSSSEFAIRQFIIKDEKKSMEQMKIWAKSQDEQIRRLSSEGCRPRLPWGVALGSFKKDPTKVFEIIEILKNDDSLYVKKSVANNLNDITKDNPHLVIEFLKQNLGKSKNLDWICKHGARTLLKKSNEEALKLFGYGSLEEIKVENFVCDSEVVMDEYLNFSFDFEVLKLQNIRLEYGIKYLKSNNIHSLKKFMISESKFEGKKEIKRKQIFKDMTTRKHYLGKHFICLFVNGKEILQREFLLK